MAAEASLPPAEAVVDPNKEPIKSIREGVIAVILQPSQANDGTYEFYLVNHNHYQQDEDGKQKTVRNGLGLVSETFKEGDSSEDLMNVLARGVIEEMCGGDPDAMSEEVFEDQMRRWRIGLEAALRPIGSFVLDGSKADQAMYFDEFPDMAIKGNILVCVDDNRMMYVGHIGQEEQEGTLTMGRRVLTDLSLEFRSVYSTPLILASPELQDILRANDITIGE